MKTLYSSRKGGFTLIEMLVVIAIIAILTGIIITGLVGSKAKSRDAKRASDLSQIALAVEQYFDRCYQYPTTIDPSTLPGTGKTLADITSDTCPSDANGKISLENFISKMPTDPSSGLSYDYAKNDPSQPTDFVLHTTFEASNSVLAQSPPAPTTWSSGFTCTNSATTPGATNLDYCVRPN